jgi:hypothetical protein
MVDLAEIQAAYYMVAATGVLVAAIYYVMTLRTTQRNMKQTLETRQAQFLMSLYQRWSDPEYQDNFFFTMFKMSWSDFEDFTKKYPADSIENNKFFTLAAFYKGIGLLVEQNLVEVETVAKLLGGDLMPFWEKFKPIILEFRVRLSQPGQFAYVEYLYDRVKDLKVIPSYKYKPDVYENLYSKP